jgi:hypothetical protein
MCGKPRRYWPRRSLICYIVVGSDFFAVRPEFGLEVRQLPVEKRFNLHPRSSDHSPAVEGNRIVIRRLYF